MYAVVNDAYAEVYFDFEEKYFACADNEVAYAEDYFGYAGNVGGQVENYLGDAEKLLWFLLYVLFLWKKKNQKKLQENDIQHVFLQRLDVAFVLLWL